MEPKTLNEICNELRAECKAIENRCRELRNIVSGPSCMRPMTSAELEEARLHPKPAPNTPEMIANVMLAVRHLEDARMRIGKVIQYSGDGVSCYDK